MVLARHLGSLVLKPVLSRGFGNQLYPVSYREVHAQQ
jgi:hypothetical protein